MNNHSQFGHRICILALLTLMVFIPITPTVTGLPKHRIGEMSLFWCIQSMLLVGVASRNKALRASGRFSPLAATGVLLALAVCFVSLSNLTFSSVQGAGLRLPGMHSGRLLPRELGYALALPLAAAFAMQFQTQSFTKPTPIAEVPSNEKRPFRSVLRSLLAVLLLMFGATCLLFAMDRWFAVLAVINTWFASIVFVAAGIEEVVYAKSQEQVRTAHL